MHRLIHDKNLNGLAALLTGSLGIVILLSIAKDYIDDLVPSDSFKIVVGLAFVFVSVVLFGRKFK